MKIALNKCHGGFGLANEYLDYIEKYFSEIECYNVINRDDIDLELYESLYGEKLPNNLEFKTGKRYIFDNDRTNPILIEALENVKQKTPVGFGNPSILEVVEIPDDSYWVILEYDGYEQLIYSKCEILTDKKDDFEYCIKGGPRK